MPTYDYICFSCGNKFEMFQSMTEKPLSNCPECGGKVKRLIGAGAGAIFKGSGFYQTDYKNTSKNSNQKNDKKISTAPETPKKKNDTSGKPSK